MKFFLIIMSIFLTTSAFATSKYYIGYLQGKGSGDRTHSYHYKDSTTISLDSSEKILKIGRQSENFNKIEFEYNQNTLSWKNDSNSSSEVLNSYKFTGVLSLLKLSYKKIIIPYIQAGMGISSVAILPSVGVGVIYNTNAHLQIDIKYTKNKNLGLTNISDTYSSVYIGLNYLF